MGQLGDRLVALEESITSRSPREPEPVTPSRRGLRHRLNAELRAEIVAKYEAVPPTQLVHE